MIESRTATDTSGQLSRSYTMRHPLKVLIADGNPAFRTEVESSLKSLRHVKVVGEAGDGLQSIDLIDRHRPDVVLLSIRMPGLTGPEIVRILHALPIVTKIVFISTYDDATNRALASALRVDGFITRKTFRQDIAPILSRLTGIPTPDGGSDIHYPDHRPSYGRPSLT